MTQLCFHCDLEIPEEAQFQLTVLNQVRDFCCPGCLAIAETICENKLEEFYRFRTTANNKATEILPLELVELEALDNHSVIDSITTTDKDTQQIELGIEGITCAACGWLIKKRIGQRKDVKDIQVNIATRRATLKFKKGAPLSPIIKQMRRLGYRAFPFNENNQEKAARNENKSYIRRLIVSGLGMMQIMMFSTGLYIGEFQDISYEHAAFLYWTSGLLATPIVAYSAFPFYKSAWRSLRYGHFGMNLPVSIAILTGYFASVFSLITNNDVFYFDSVAMFTFFLLVGRFLEHRMRLKAIFKQQNFKKLLPLSISRKNGDGGTEVILVNDIMPEDKLIINAGSIVPVDGLLISDTAELNEAILTGEFVPVAKQKQDPIISGSTNNSASFLMQATSRLNDSRLQKIIQLQDRSDNLSSEHTTVADRVANWYVAGLLILCVVTGIAWWHLEPVRVFPVVLSLLVVSCPCALSLATPAAIAAAISQLTDKGLMINSRDALSKLSRISDIFVDKTGTLTLGRMTLIKTLVYSEIGQASCNQIAASLESVSDHPVAEAFKRLNVKSIPNVISQEVIAGGVRGKINRDLFMLGKADFVTCDTNETVLNEYRTQDNNPVEVVLYLTKNNQHIATFILTDEVNPSSKKMIERLQKSHFDTTLISGDSKRASNHIARKLNIKNIIADATPESKLQQVKQAQQQGKQILMLGDGVNDIGALSEASVGITMGTASHLSRSSSSAVLVSHDLEVVNDAITISKRLDRIIKQNLSWAVLYNLVVIPFAMMGLVPAWMAAIGMTGSSLVVVLNALRLRH